MKALADKINKAFELCDEIDALGYGIGHGYKQRDSLKAEFMVFVLFFSMENGGITDENSAFVKEYLDTDMPKEMMENLYKPMVADNIVYQDGDFSTKVPATIQSFVMVDNKIYAESNDSTKSYAGFVAEVYDAMGKEFFASDSVSSDVAEAKFKSFTDRIADYLKDNLVYDYILNF